jgi:hypothetical protein
VRHVRMLGLCLVAALALGAYAVSSASALEWGKCEYVGAGGNYGGPGATEGDGHNCAKSEKAHPKLTGEYEWRKASEVAAKREAENKNPNVHFTGASTGKGLLSTGDFECAQNESAPFQITRQKCAELAAENPEKGIHEFWTEGVSVECEGETNEGETEGKNKIANIEVVFEGCTIEGAPCQSFGAVNPEEIVVNTLKGKLGWIDKTTSPKQVGVLLEPQAGKHARFAEFECAEGFVETVVGVGNKKEGSFYLSGGCIGICEGATPEEEKHGGYDGIISPITPVNEMTPTFEQKFVSNGSVDAPANQPESFEGKHRESLEDYVTLRAPEYEFELGIQWSPASEEVTNINTPEEEGEIKA